MLASEVVPGQDILGLLTTTEIPEVQWVDNDDLCDCVFQRIGWWTNPHIARTLEIRLCCIFAELGKQYPQFIREIPAFDNYNEHEYQVEPVAWGRDYDMPRGLWYRQLAVQHGLPLPTIRNMYENDEPPKAVVGAVS